jgi:hypothetical protein
LLNPHDRGLLLESLRPPPGYSLDFAIATTFSLDLKALLAAPLAFTFFDWEDEDGRPTADTIALLEAVRRHADRIAVFCQAGQISIPQKNQPLYGYLEDSVFEVAPANAKGVFHPKVWALRYVNTEGSVHYRVLCLSRNLTYDRSWDTVLLLDGTLTDRKHAFGVNHPLGDFIAALPELALRQISESVRSKIQEMDHEIRRVHLGRPPGCDAITFWPLGIPGHRKWPFEARTDRFLVVSPFLSEHFLTRVSKSGRGDILVSRLEELTSIKQDCLDRFDRVCAFSSDAWIEDAEELEQSDSRNVPSEEAGTRGLHTKLYIADAGWDASVWLGSANATDAAYKRNVEFLVELKGKKSALGIDAFLTSSEKATTFADLLQDFARADGPAEVSEEVKEAEQLVEDARREIVRARFVAHVEQISAKDEYRILLRSEKDSQMESVRQVEVKCWPVTMREDVAAIELTIGTALTFERLTFDALTTFYAFEITGQAGTHRITRRFVLNVPLEGAPTDRRERILRSLLKDRDHVLRLLLLLLSGEGTHGYEDVLTKLPGDRGAGEGQIMGFESTLFESLVHALDKDPTRLDQVSQIVDDLKKTSEGSALMPPRFDEIWEPIWAARQRLGK